MPTYFRKIPNVATNADRVSLGVDKSVDCGARGDGAKMGSN
jgi:hypothetical protein